MKIFNSLDEFAAGAAGGNIATAGDTANAPPEPSGQSVPPTRLAIGIFDGVHLGHREVIAGAVNGSAIGTAGTAGVLTFNPHPSRLFTPETPVPLIFDDAENARRLAATGAAFLVRQPFTRDFAALDASAFLALLKRALPALASIHVGDNFRCGKRRAAGVPELRVAGAAHGIEVVAAAEVRALGERVSSTRIRQLLAAGDIADANTLLGAPYANTGSVVSGRALGRTIGFPTLNLRHEPEQLPRFGVYAVRVTVENSTTDAAPVVFAGIANYGLRPTVERDATAGNAAAGAAAGADAAAVRPLLEVHLLDTGTVATGTIPATGARLRVEWLRFIRPERKFPSLDALRAQIATDIAAAGGTAGVLPVACSMSALAQNFLASNMRPL
ncbi:MAG: riboflavin biosynthesis protein RibF [Puniceicoccales bacterium]|jgi:riboflavin kinase/FMN adenylyltransferase|nr:riboflavin biosynthesis protein RibF [Puniceicoccales bacterium]